MTATTKRRRRLNVGSGNAAKAELAKLERLMVEYHEANEAANAAKRKADATRKEIAKAMADIGIREHSVQRKLGGAMVTLKAHVEKLRRNVVDVLRLRKLVPDDVFMGIITATQASVKAKAGTDVLEKVLVQKEGREVVKIDVAK